MRFKKFYMSLLCPKQTDSSVLINEASKEFAQVIYLENFFFLNDIENTKIFGR